MTTPYFTFRQRFQQQFTINHDLTIYDSKHYHTMALLEASTRQPLLEEQPSNVGLYRCPVKNFNKQLENCNKACQTFSQVTVASLHIHNLIMA